MVNPSLEAGMEGNQASGPICPSCKSDGPHFIWDYSDPPDPLAIALRCKSCEAGWWEVLAEDS